jgi:hypothetical protein
MDEKEEIKQLILKKEKEGEVVFTTFNGLASANIDDFIKQPIEGLLYDLNRDKATILANLAQQPENELKWVNDYAVALVITGLKKEIEKLQDLANENLYIDPDIRVMNAVNNELNLSTRGMGKGKVFTFDNFGEIKKISYQDLMQIVDAHWNFTQERKFLILNSCVVRNLGLEEIYQPLLEKLGIQKIEDLEKYLQESGKSLLQIKE